MIKYEVKAVVCDYGIYENGELKLVVNSRGNALLIKAILEQDLQNKVVTSDFVKTLYNKYFRIPNNFYCNGCRYLSTAPRRDGKSGAEFYCRQSGLYKVPNGEGYLIKDNQCISNLTKALKRSKF